jgi:hypothetical protein
MVNRGYETYEGLACQRYLTMKRQRECIVRLSING